MQALLGLASRGDTRRDLLRECFRLVGRREPYAGSSEEMTPLGADWLSVVPLGLTAGLLLAKPSAASKLARGFGAHLLSRESIRQIESATFS
jgi:hypothetical protein